MGLRCTMGRKTKKQIILRKKTPVHHHAVYHTYNMRRTKINTGPSMDGSVEGIYQIGDSTCHPSFHMSFPCSSYPRQAKSYTCRASCEVPYMNERRGVGGHRRRSWRVQLHEIRIKCGMKYTTTPLNATSCAESLDVRKEGHPEEK